MGEEDGLVAGLVRIGRLAAGDARRDGEPVILSDRADALVVRVGDVVVKAHPTDTDETALAVRLRVATDPRLRGVLLPPLDVPLAGRSGAYDRTASASAGRASHGPAVRVCGRLVTAWPAGEPVDPDDPDLTPWEQAARLLACLHSVPAATVGSTGLLPLAGGPGRVARAMARLEAADGTPAAAEVRRAFARLPPWAQGAAPPAAHRAGVLVHGDWHLGQLVRWRAAPAVAAEPGPAPRPPVRPRDADGWRLIDVDDLGAGDPAWDLARPAAWYAAGLLPPEVWQRFLAAYRASGGCAVPPDGDPWPVLDVPARALVVQSAALGVAAASHTGRPLDEVEEALVDACRRIVRVGAPG